MGLRSVLILAAVLGGLASAASAQAPPEPPLLALPMGARIRLQTAASPGQWLKGVLVSADSASIALVPQDAPPLGPNQLRLPTTSVGRFELQVGSKRHWLAGAIVGLAAGLVTGFTTNEVDPVACDQSSYFGSSSTYFCSRGEAVAVYGVGFTVIGAAIGGLVKTDRWTPIAVDALAPAPPPRVSGWRPQLRVRPDGGVGLGLTVGF